jgi:hypothetical protein
MSKQIIICDVLCSLSWTRIFFLNEINAFKFRGQTNDKFWMGLLKIMVGFMWSFFVYGTVLKELMSFRSPHVPKRICTNQKKI